MRGTFAAVLLLGATACGPGGATGDVPGLEVVLSRAYVNRLASFQVSILAKAETLDPEAVEKTCVAGQGHAFVQQQDGEGRTVNARTFDAAVLSGQQELRLSGIPYGREYLFVVEALSSDATPVLLGSGSARVQNFQGDVRPAPITVGELSPAPACDPRIR